MSDQHDQDDAGVIDDLELDGTESDIDEVAGGSVPRPPGGPVPIPYPNTAP